MAEGEVETSDFQYPIMKESPKSNGEGFIINLQNQLRTLEKRVKELELENAKLSSQLSNCRCRNKSSTALSPGNGLVSRGPSFAPEEDLALSQSWLEGSRDPVIGMTPKKDTLWECITDCYGSRKPHHLPIRTTKSLQCRWNTISSAVKKLQGCVRQVELSNPSSSSELDILVENVNYNVVHGNTLIQESKKLSVDVSHEDAVGHEERSNVDGTKEFESQERSPGRIAKTMHHAPKRYVAMKIMYFGQRFYGFASQQVEPTIESEIFKALEKTRLLVCDKNESRYTRCGRTDKGVSSVGQVISLLLRSKSGDTQVSGDRKDLSPEDMCGEIDYVRVLNGVLPKDIRVISWCSVPKDFHARFGCLSRTYKYLFWRENLNLAEMEIAAMKFVGEHDFRNFCKMDAANVHNYRRHITSFEFSRCNSRSEGDELWVMTINGSAFLWHQIRCMVAVLFMIGHGLELPSVIDELLDTNRTPRKPQYVMAPELPLILQSCEFEHLRYICSPDAGQSLREHLRNEIRHYKLQAAIFEEALLSCSNTIKDRSPSSHIKKKAVHIPLMSRPTEPSYEERQAKHKARTV